jgi:hypothetical protein
MNNAQIVLRGVMFRKLWTFVEKYEHKAARIHTYVIQLVSTTRNPLTEGLFPRRGHTEFQKGYGETGGEIRIRPRGK